MSSPFENSIQSFTSPQGILRDHLRNSLLAFQARTMRGRRSGPSITPLRRPLSQFHPKEYVTVLESYSQGPPVYPSYLSNTIYAHLVEEQYSHYRKKYGATKHKGKNGKISVRKASTPKDSQRTAATYLGYLYGTNDSSNDHSNNSIDNTHAGPSSSVDSPGTMFFPEDDAKPIRNRINTDPSSRSSLAVSSSYDPSKYNSYLSRLELQDLRLPTAWSVFDRGDDLDLGRDFNEISFKGNSDDQTTTSSIRSNYSIKRQCGLFYYEIKIETGDHENDGHISIGLCSEFSRLNRLPGSDEYSYGYHGECGYLTGGPIAHNDGTRKYEASFGIGDIIGCGIDFSNNTLFYTKNGVHLGTAFWNVEEKELYPFVGFKSAGERITANFGQGRPFAFDIDQYRKGVADGLVNQVLSITPLSPPPTDTQRKSKSSTMDDLVLDYLNHSGYIGTCLKMKSEMTGGINGKDQERHERFKVRQDICTDLRNGQIDQVFIKCEQHYPQMLQLHPRLLFRLECQKFIDLVKSLDHGHKSSPKKKKGLKAGNKRRRSMLETNDSDDLEAMDVDDDNDEYNWCDLQAVMDFGRYLHENYAPKATTTSRTASSILKMMDGSNDDFADVDVKAELNSTFSILAYENPTDNPKAYLYEPGWREKMASELNDAILMTEGESPVSSLEKLYRQTNVTLHELILNGNGKASMIPSLDSLF